MPKFQFFWGERGTLQNNGYSVEFGPKFQPLQQAHASQIVSHILRMWRLIIAMVDKERSVCVGRGGVRGLACPLFIQPLLVSLPSSIRCVEQDVTTHKSGRWWLSCAKVSLNTFTLKLCSQTSRWSRSNFRKIS